jgi:hypothetical protein
MRAPPDCGRAEQQQAARPSEGTAHLCQRQVAPNDHLRPRASFIELCNPSGNSTRARKARLWPTAERSGAHSLQTPGLSRSTGEAGRAETDVCLENRQHGAGTRRVHQPGHARARAGTADTPRRADLQEKRDGKEGVDGSSPSESFDEVPANRHFVVACSFNTRTHFRHICGTRDAVRRPATPPDTPRSSRDRGELLESPC